MFNLPLAARCFYHANFRLFVTAFLLLSICVPAGAEISVVWEKEIPCGDRSLNPYSLFVTDKGIVRVTGVTYLYRKKEDGGKTDLMLTEYRLNLDTGKSESKTLMPMDAGDITLTLPSCAIKKPEMIDENVAIVRKQYKSHDFEELTIGGDWKVTNRQIPGPADRNVSTYGACRNTSGDVFLCGGKGYISKVDKDASLVWDVNYKSEKYGDATKEVAYSKRRDVIVALGFSAEPDTKFTSRDSNLWLANVDSEGSIISKTQFDGVMNFGKDCSLYLDTDDNPVVIYDVSKEIADAEMQITKFSKDLQTKLWTTTVFKEENVMVSGCSMRDFGKDKILAVFTYLNRKKMPDCGGVPLAVYILDKDGKIVDGSRSQCLSVWKDLAVVYEDKIFVLSKTHENKNGQIRIGAKLVCLKVAEGT